MFALTSTGHTMSIIDVEPGEMLGALDIAIVQKLVGLLI
jgi:hypothetical protein